MAIRARLSAPREETTAWPWHHAKWTAIGASVLWSGGRRMEAENYLSGGYGIRLAMDARKNGRGQLGDLVRVWQPSRLKGIIVSREYGTPFLAATQVFDLRPVPRKFLSLDRTDNVLDRMVSPGQIMVTCSGNVGRATLAHRPHQDTLISHDLLRVSPKEDKHWGWVYAYLRSPQARAMMSAAQYGHIIKHLEVAHLNALPIPLLHDDLLAEYGSRVNKILAARNQANDKLNEAEAAFEKAIGSLDACGHDERGFSVRASSLYSGRRRLEGFFHNPTVRSLRSHFSSRSLTSCKLMTLGFDVWLPNRFKRIQAVDGVELLDSSDLFEINPDIARRIADIDFGDQHSGRVKSGWLMVSRSGQVYGLNGSVAIAHAFHEGKVVSDDVIRVASRSDAKMRPGYLYMALSHPTLGRPLVKAQIYGSSIPHLEVADLANLEVVRVGSAVEDRIADLIEEAACLWANADILENELALQAGELIDQFLAGDTTAFIVP